MSNGWSEYQREVIGRLERLERGQERMDEKIGHLEIGLATVRVQSGFVGALAGCLPAAVIVALELVR